MEIYRYPELSVYTIGHIFMSLDIKELNLSKEYIIDIFPVSVCRNIRIPKCKLLQGRAYRGFTKSKKRMLLWPQNGSPSLPIWCFLVQNRLHRVMKLCQSLHLLL